MKKTSKIKTPPTNLDQQLEQLKQLKSDELRERWQAVFGSNPPAKIRSSLMIQALARQLQENAFGGLKSSTRRLLQKVAEEARAWGQRADDRTKGPAAGRHGSGAEMAQRQTSGAE